LSSRRLNDEVIMMDYFKQHSRYLLVLGVVFFSADVHFVATRISLCLDGGPFEMGEVVCYASTLLDREAFLRISASVSLL
jgi:hypothetical protein